MMAKPNHSLTGESKRQLEERLGKLSAGPVYIVGNQDNDEIGKRILRHAADYLYVEHGIEKSKKNPNCITFYDRKAEVLGLAMQELQFAIVRINNGKEHN